MTKAPARAQRTLASPVIATGIAATVLIAAGAFILSFAALTDLAVMAGINPTLAWIWPVIVDGLIVASTVSIVALAGHEARTMAYPWALLLGGAAVSTGANAVHAILAVDTAAVPAWVSAVVASMPPIILLAVTHLSVILVQKAGAKPARKSRPVAATARRSRVSNPEPAAEPVTAPAPREQPVEGAQPQAPRLVDNVTLLHAENREDELKTAV